jgi:hypothetical protein
LGNDFFIQELSHFRIRADLPDPLGFWKSSTRRTPIWRLRFSLEIVSLPQQKRER